MNDAFKVVDFRTTKFVMVPRSLVEDKTLKSRDKLVYMALCLYANNDTKQARPSINTIGERVGVSRSSVIRALEALEKAEYIARQPRYFRQKKQTSNEYYLLDK